MNSDDEAENYKDNTNGLNRQLEGISIYHPKVSAQAEAGEATQAEEAGHPAKSKTKRKSKRELKAEIKNLRRELEVKKTIKKKQTPQPQPQPTHQGWISGEKIRWGVGGRRKSNRGKKHKSKQMKSRRFRR